MFNVFLEQFFSVSPWRMTGLGSAQSLHSAGSRFLHLTYSCPLCVLAPRSFGLCTAPHRGVRWDWGSVHLSSDRISSGRGADVIAGTTRFMFWTCHKEPAM